MCVAFYGTIQGDQVSTKKMLIIYMFNLHANMLIHADAISLDENTKIPTTFDELPPLYI